MCVSDQWSFDPLDDDLLSIGGDIAVHQLAEIAVDFGSSGGRFSTSGNVYFRVNISSS